MSTATVAVDGRLITGEIYHVRSNGWPCVQSRTGRIASGPVVPTETGMVHGPVQWLEPEPPTVPARHESQRLFTPVDVMPGQLTVDCDCGYTPMEPDPPGFASHGLI
jgi:hypothetical protein